MYIERLNLKIKIHFLHLFIIIRPPGGAGWYRGVMPGASAAYSIFHFSVMFQAALAGALARLKARRIFFNGDFIVRHAVPHNSSTRLNAVHHWAGAKRE